MAEDRPFQRPKQRRVTIRDVAAAAGVSLQTVSRVLNDSPNVRGSVQDRVRKAIEELGYVPSLAARRMAGKRSYLLLALNDRSRTIEGWRSGDGTDWIDQMLLGGMTECANHGYRMIFELVDTHSAHVEREILAALAALHPDGVILTPPHGDNPVIRRLLSDKHIPFARMGSKGEGSGFAVGMDEFEAARAATDHLLSLGHERIAFITGSQEYKLSQMRLDGYRRAMSEAGHDDPSLVASGDFSFDSGAKATRDLLAIDGRPTAILASNDQMALAAIETAKAEGLSLPADLSVISFDDTPIVKFCTPSLTAIRQPIAEMTACAAKLLIGAAGGATPSQTESVLPFKLIVRQSTAPPRGDDRRRIARAR